MTGTEVVAGGRRGTADPAARVEPPPGVLLRSYRLSLRSIDWTGRTVGGAAIGSTRLLGLPRQRTQQLASVQARGLHGVVDWSDRMGTHWAHGVGATKRGARTGARLAARGWAREMKFFITLH
jgi:hypothetical protein